MKLLPTNCATTEEAMREILRRPGAVLLVAPDVYHRLQTEPPPAALGFLGGIPVRVERALAPGTVAAFDERAAFEPLGWAPGDHPGAGENGGGRS